MNKKIKLAISATVFALCLNVNGAFAQFNFIVGTTPVNIYGRTALSGNVRGIGIGNFTNANLPLSALHVNTNLFPVGFQTGEVFRTDAPINFDTFWRLHRGGIERARFYNRSTDESLVIEAVQPTGNIEFHTQSQAGAVSRMVITDGVFNPAVSGFIGVGNNFFNPQSRVHLHDGITPDRRLG